MRSTAQNADLGDVRAWLGGSSPDADLAPAPFGTAELRFIGSWILQKRSAVLDFLRGQHLLDGRPLLVAYVDSSLRLLRVDQLVTLGAGLQNGHFGSILHSARSAGAAGFFVIRADGLSPGRSEVDVIGALAAAAEARDIHLIDYLSLSGGELRSLKALRGP